MAHSLTSLGDANHIIAHVNGRDAVALNWSGILIPSQLNVLEHCGMETSILERGDWLNAGRALLDDVDLRNSEL